MGGDRRARRGLACAGIGLASVALAVPFGLSAAAAHAAAASLTSHLDNGVCVVSGAPSVVPKKAALVVPRHPTGAAILWLPGLNSTTCAIATTHLGAAPAAALARAITRAPAISNGARFNCAADDGTGASITFTYAQHRLAPSLTVDLSGCRSISQSGKKSRSMTTDVSRALARRAPCPWRTDLVDAADAC
jgi:hypothetical protein